MGLLDNESIYQKIDKEGMLQNIQELPDQVEDAWKKVKKFAIPTHYIKAKNAVVLGMGGSAIGGDLTISLARSIAKIPIIIVRDYELPAFVDSNTLVVIVSYSGNTEEPIGAFSEAAQRGAKLIAVSSGAKVASICRKYKVPMFEISYGAMPRAAIGYTFIPVVGIFNKLGYLALSEDEPLTAVLLLKAFQKKINTTVPTSQNTAKQLAQKLKDKIPIVIGSGIMTSVARRTKTQFNENSKTCAIFEELPEICHNTIEGLNYPTKLHDKIFFLFLESKYDHKRNRLRQQIFYQILQKKGLGYESIFLNCKGGRLSEVLHYILFVDYVSYYLSILHGIDPSEIKSIEYLKDKLSEVK